VSWYRWRAQRLLRTTGRPGGFGLRARVALLWSLAQYLSAISVLTVVAVLVATTVWAVRLDRSTVVALLGLLFLGGAMFVCLLLHAFDCCWGPLAACAVALIGEAALHGRGVLTLSLVYLGLLVLVGGYAAVVLGRAALHAR
jgi:hypothetical protein